MKSESLIILAISLLFFMIGLGLNLAGLNSYFATGFGAYLDYVILCGGAFVFSTLLYGYFAPLYLLYFGTIQGSLLVENPIVGLFSLGGIMISSYSGIIFAEYLKEDFDGNDNLFHHLKEYALPFAFAIILCIIAVAIMPFAPTTETIIDSFSGIFG